VALGDVDNDGDLDVVSGNYFQSSTLYLNQGGTLASTPAWSSGPAPGTLSVALGDVDGDGYLDLVCGNSGDGTTLYLNHGGTFDTAPVWDSGTRTITSSVALGDVDGDGDLDLVCGANGASGNLYRNLGGTFDPTPAWSSPDSFTTSIALGDVDGDGDLDLVCGNYGQRSTLFLNQGGTFDVTPAWSSGSAANTTSVALGDGDGDGDLDLVCANYNQSSTFYRNQAGTFATSPNSSIFAPNTVSVALGDMDADGDLDVVLGGFGQNSSLYLNQGSYLSYGWGSRYGEYTASVALGDIDGDGFLDLVCGNKDHTKTLYLNWGFNILSTSPRLVGATENTYAVALGDVNGDGDLDLVCGNYNQNTTLYLNQDGTFAATPAWSSGPPDYTYSVALGDVDGDGDLDLVCGNQYARGTTLYLNQGGTFTTNPVWASEAEQNTLGVALGDVDGDGDLDLIRGNYGWSTTLYLNQGGTFTTPVWSSAARRTRSVALGDVDGDGDLDLVCGNENERSTLYRNQGGTFAATPAWSSGPSNATYGVALGDLDGDGDLDLVCANSGGGSTLYLNQGGTFATTPAWEGWVAGAVALGDVNGDGSLDLIFNSGVYLNQGPTLFAGAPDWTPTGTYSIIIAAGDIDGDGDLDVVGVTYNGSKSLYTGVRLPPLKGDPLNPRNQLPNNSAWLRNVRVERPSRNSLRFSFTAVDVESDAVRVVAEYQYEGDPQWLPLQFTTTSLAGPFSSSPSGTSSFPSGEAYALDCDITRFPFDRRNVIVRLKAISHPHRAGVIQGVASYSIPVGPLVPHRPQVGIPAAPLSFETVTLGDTVETDLVLTDTGSDTLVVNEVDLPSTEMALGVPTPLKLGPGESMPIAVSLRPVLNASVSGMVTVRSNDPISPLVEVPITTEIRPLAVSTQLIVPPDGIQLGEALTVIVTPKNGARIEEGTLHVVVPGGAGGSFPLVPLGDTFVGLIPGSLVTEAGLSYYVELRNLPASATDPTGAPTASYPVAVPVPALLTSVPQPNSGDDFLDGRDVRVILRVEEGTVFEQGTLHYRRGGESGYASAAVTLEGGILSAVIPGSAAGPRGLEYWGEVTTRSTTLREPPSGSRPRAIQVKVQETQEGASYPARVYRMVSVPLDFGPDFTGNLETLLRGEGAFGTYDPLRWRCFRYAPGLEQYLELSDPAHLEEFYLRPGRAFWIISREQNQIRFGFPALSVSTAGDFSIALAPGWNQVGNPFDFEVPWDSVRVTPDPEAVEPPRHWDPRAGAYDTGDVTVWQPFEGYFVWNEGPSDALLSIPPTTGEEIPVQARAAGGTKDRAPPVSSAAGRESGESGWRIHVAASTEGASDPDKVAGVAPEASEGRDRWDRSEPPPSPGPTLSLYFLGPAVPGASPREGSLRPLASDIRSPLAAAPEAEAGHAWRLDLLKTFARESSADEVRLRFRGLEEVPASLSVWLLDRALGGVVDLRQQPEYRFFLAERERVRAPDEARFELRVGSQAFVRSGPARPVPDRMRLLPCYPNPARVATVIRYEQAEPGEITLRIFDVGGRQVKVLRASHDAPGRYELAWKADDDQARRVVPGLYLVRLEQGSRRESRKLLVVR
jgi:hypothetical protein